jgi:hypothetical protein
MSIVIDVCADTCLTQPEMLVKGFLRSTRRAFRVRRNLPR